VHRDDRDLALLLAPRPGAELDCLARAREELGDGHPGDLLLLCHEGDARLARAALAAGISAFLTADDDAEGFAHAVTTATHARPYVSPSVGARLASPDADDPLTDREREVLRLVALGYTSEQVGGELYLSVRTVESHRSAIIRKLDCADRRDVVSHALRLGLLR
jgi:two-component system response regulator NreC